jgi:hypothetical protein
LPVANTSTVSEVEVSLSTVMAVEAARIGLLQRHSCKQRWLHGGVGENKPSIVAMSGAIMPEPLMMPACRW